MVMERPKPGDMVWICRFCGKPYQPAEIDFNNPTCRDLTCRGPLTRDRL